MELEDKIKDFFDAIADKSKARADYDLAKIKIWENLKSLRKHTPKNEYQVLKMRFYEGMTLEGTGRAMGVTRERIRQIEATAITRLKVAINDDNFKVINDKSF